MVRRKRDWISGAIEHPGALRRWFKRNRRRLRRLLGYDPFKRDGTLRDRAVRDTLLLAEEGRLRVKRVTEKRLRLALTLARLRRRRRRGRG